jgi:hypothetical protein
VCAACLGCGYISPGSSTVVARACVGGPPPARVSVDCCCVVAFLFCRPFVVAPVQEVAASRVLSCVVWAWLSLIVAFCLASDGSASVSGVSLQLFLVWHVEWICRLGLLFCVEVLLVLVVGAGCAPAGARVALPAASLCCVLGA